ncbi:MAG TPA: hypothetical protein VF625_00175 [Longimicrobium sp.]|jgi:hypothetical protein
MLMACGIVVLAACSGEQPPAAGGDEPTQEAKTGVAQDQRALNTAAEGSEHREGADPPRNVVDPRQGMTQAGAFTALGNSGVSGTLSIMPAEGGTRVNVTVNGPAGGAGAYRVALHGGRCGQLGAAVAAVGEIQTGAATMGSFSGSIPVPVTEVMDGNHSMVLTGGGPAPVACATIPRNAPMPGTNP